MYFIIQLNKIKSIRDNNKLSYCSVHCNSKIENGKLKCDCGNDVDIFEWCWEKDDTSINFLLDPYDLEVTFHPVYSSGTAVVKGNKPFLQNRHYYWEIKMISNLYGTDVMLGVGTNKTMNCKYRFCSMLGLDDQSWGYSYRGIIQHNKLTRKYGLHFGLGCIIGVHLNMCTGTLEFYLDREPLGIAFDGLKDKELYPMACSTSAQTAMKLNCAVSQEETLQMLCLKCVQQHESLYEKYKTIPGLYRYYERKYFWMGPSGDINAEDKNRDEEDEDLHLMTIKNDLSVKKRKKRSPDYVWCKPSKKTTISRSNTSESDDLVSRPSSSSNSDDCTDEKAMENEDICKLLYECLSDSDSDFHDSDTDKIDLLLPMMNDSDSSSSH